MVAVQRATAAKSHMRLPLQVVATAVEVRTDVSTEVPAQPLQTAALCGSGRPGPEAPRNLHVLG